MFDLGFRSLCCAFLLAGASAPLLTGCSQADQGEVAEAGGIVELALSTTGADGAVYGFPEATYLQLNTTNFSEWVSLTGSETVLRKELAAGEYTASLWFQAGNVQLVRSESGSTTLVDAEWTNTQPIALSIADGQTTPLTLQFSLDELGDVAFGTGTLQVVAEVDVREVEQATSASVSGTTNLSYEQYSDATAAYATALDVDQGIDLAFSLGFQASSDWYQVGTSSVCQRGTVAESASSSSVGLDLRLQQLSGTSATLCVINQGAADDVSLTMNVYGAPPAGQEAFLPDPQYGFYGSIYGSVGDVFDGTTLEQAELQNATLSNGNFYHMVYDLWGTQLATVEGSATGTFQLEP